MTYQKNNGRSNNANTSLENTYESWLGSASAFLKERQASFLEEHKLAAYSERAWNQTEGKLVFSGNGQLQLEAEVQLVGFLAGKPPMWTWGWVNGSSAAFNKLRKQGEKFQSAQLIRSSWRASENDGWKMTALLAKELNAIGACRTPFENGYAYLLVTKVKMANKSKLFNLFRQK